MINSVFLGRSTIPRSARGFARFFASLEVPDSMGVIIRTVGQGQRTRYFIRDLSILLQQWEDIQRGLEELPAPVCLFQEPDLIERTVRDFLTDEVDAVIIDDAKAYERMQELVGQISSRARKRIQQYTGSQPVFDCFGVQAQIDAAFHRQVWLPCGGYIVIDETEALIAVDVNTGRNKGAKDIERTILQTNLEAADEICRQMRLRNVGGIIIADFIDMKQPERSAGGLSARQRAPQARQGPHSCAAYLPAWTHGDDAPTSRRELGQHAIRPVSALQRPRRCQKPDDNERRASTSFALGHA